MLYSKGVYDYLDCANSLYKKGYSFQFVLLGIEDNSIDSINPKHFISKITNPNFKYVSNKRDITEYFNKGDLFCFMSYREGLPKVLLEASLFKMPLISYDVPGCREVIQDNMNGYLVEFKKKDEFENKIIFIANNPDLRKKMGEKAKLHVEKNFSDKIILDLYKNIWIKS